MNTRIEVTKRPIWQLLDTFLAHLVRVLFALIMLLAAWGVLSAAGCSAQVEPKPNEISLSSSTIDRDQEAELFSERSFQTWNGSQVAVWSPFWGMF